MHHPHYSRRVRHGSSPVGTRRGGPSSPHVPHSPRSPGPNQCAPGSKTPRSRRLYDPVVRASSDEGNARKAAAKGAAAASPETKVAVSTSSTTGAKLSKASVPSKELSAQEKLKLKVEKMKREREMKEEKRRRAREESERITKRNICKRWSFLLLMIPNQLATQSSPNFSSLVVPPVSGSTAAYKIQSAFRRKSGTGDSGVENGDEF